MDRTFFGVYEGYVYDNADPLKLGRVRVVVPGILHPYSDWLMPAGQPGAGSDARGLWFIPAIGSNVLVLFKAGDPDRGRYLAGPWGAPDGATESPTFVRDLSAEDAPHVAGLQTSRWEIVIDDRDGNSNLLIRDRRFPDNAIGISGETQTVEISGTVGVQIKSSGIVNIQALQVVINGRIVLPSGKPI
jgi:uncharacterized protein involved in type VI secretion and phage assembly